MKNLPASTKVCIDFHRAVVDSKRNTPADPTYKTRLVAMDVNVTAQYQIYETAFATNNLVTTSPHPHNPTERADLLNLYSYKAKLIRELKTEITTTSSGRVISTCQNCTINAVNSLDHQLPKEEFNEFVVNPKNLLPTCTECNSYKGVFWRDGGRRLFLNLYLDILPNERYLFTDIQFVNNTFRITFFVKNTNGIAAPLYDLIESHYTRLHLCRRFSENIDKVIIPFVNAIKPNLGTLTLAEVTTNALETERLNKLAFGFNFWESLLKIDLLSNADFIGFIQAP